VLRSIWMSNGSARNESKSTRAERAAPSAIDAQDLRAASAAICAARSARRSATFVMKSCTYQL